MTAVDDDAPSSVPGAPGAAIPAHVVYALAVLRGAESADGRGLRGREAEALAVIRGAYSAAVLEAARRLVGDGRAAEVTEAAFRRLPGALASYRAGDFAQWLSGLVAQAAHDISGMPPKPGEAARR